MTDDHPTQQGAGAARDDMSGDAEDVAALRTALALALARVEELEAALPPDSSPVPSPMLGRADRPCSPAGFPLLERGMELLFAPEAGNGIFLAAGWWNEEAWGVWGRGARQSLRFAVGPDYHGGFVDLTLTILCLIRPGGASPSLSVVANGYFIRTVTLTGPARKYLFRLPPSCLGQGDVLVQLDYSDPLVPESEFDSIDVRLLGVGLTAMSIS
jgi:hypothetical protein